MIFSRDLAKYLDKIRDQEKYQAKLSEIESSINNTLALYNKVVKSGRLSTFKEMVELIDKCIAELPLRDQREHSCRRGCDACCHYDVSIYPQEAELILRFCRKKKIPIDTEYLKQQAAIPLRERSASLTHSACVFLEKGECKIYPVRPINCRKLFRMNAPVHCNAKLYPHGTPGSEVITRVNINVEVVISVLQSAGERTGSMPELLLTAQDTAPKN
ncbi:MAG: YkgJ family cysteine cluster protein [Filimonas sp.]|nr:YkgJ family cysteine cluster protein [Filimonas sp.]